MKDPVRHAAANNARWCDLVCRSHGVRTMVHSRFWAARERSPELYPDAVTLHPSVAPEDVLEAVQPGQGCSVKDAFATLDLGGLGFDELFRAQWIFRDPAPARPGDALTWSVVETDVELAEWARAADLAGTMRGELLRDPSVRVLAARGPDGVVAGAIANRTGPVVGVSNVFTSTVVADEVWAGVAGAAGILFPALPLVGYDRGEQLAAALAAGFTVAGPLRVWLEREAAAADR